jgi:hypothetical protein
MSLAVALIYLLLLPSEAVVNGMGIYIMVSTITFNQSESNIVEVQGWIPQPDG